MDVVTALPGTVPVEQPLAGAHEYLLGFLNALHPEEFPTERAILAPIVDVVDQARRIVDGPGLEYKASKAGLLLEAAVRVQVEAIVAFAGDGIAENAIRRLTDRMSADMAPVLNEAWRIARLSAVDGTDPGAVA
ncbi:MAG: hypothetical protein JWM89_1836 [Acidimicrobiales bacterium]|nr:hypothetical protein [Acidimicrobiales bacterium]